MLRIISQYLQSNSDVVENFGKKDFTYPPFEGVDQAKKIFGSDENLEKTIKDINKNLLNQ